MLSVDLKLLPSYYVEEDRWGYELILYDNSNRFAKSVLIEEGKQNDVKEIISNINSLLELYHHEQLHIQSKA